MMTRFSVKNYKCLADVDIPLTPIHVIIGQNDSGKTSLLEAILALHQSVVTPLPSAFPGKWEGNDLVYEGANDARIDFEAGFRNHHSAVSNESTYHLSVLFPEKGSWCNRVDEWFDNGEAHHIAQFRSHVSGLLARLDSQESPEERLKLNDLAETIGIARLYRLDPKMMAVPASIDPLRKFRLDQDGFGLATLLDDILGNDYKIFGKVSDQFCTYFPQFRKVRIETESASSRQYSEAGLHAMGQGVGKGIYFETIQGRTIRAQQASDGAILFLGLLALMSAPNPPKLLLIEEPEKGVYPKRLAEVIDLLRKLEADSVNRPVPQIILTTHSPLLLSSFKPEEVTLLRREVGTGPVKAYPLRDAPNIEERMGGGEFYLGELWYNLSEEELLGHV